MMVTRRSKSRWFEDEHSQMLDPLEIDKLGTVLEKLRHAHVLISTGQESQNYQGDQQIQGKRQPKMMEKGREYCFSTQENKSAIQTPQKVQ